MSYIQLSALDKHNRNNQINTGLGAAAYLMIYVGPPPLSPDITVSSADLLVALPCSNPFGIVRYFVQDTTIHAGGTNGTDGLQTITGTTGTGTKFQAAVTIAGNAIASVNSITVPGSYSVLPTMDGEPVTGGSLVGATLNLQISSIITAGAIAETNATNTGLAGFARFAVNNTAGGVGIVDLDVGTANASVIVNTTSIFTGGLVSVLSATIAEA